MKGYRLTPVARDDLREIQRYIAQDSPDAARRVMARFRGEMERLAERPLIGHLRQDLTEKPLRFWPVYSYLVIYIPETKPVQIVRILHAARDVQTLLEG